jgi:hypothetical protein
MEGGQTSGINSTERRNTLSQHSATGTPVDRYIKHMEYQCKSSTPVAPK